MVPMTVSVIIPTYRRNQSLRRTLDSLAQQTLQGLEIVIVDNAGDALTQSLVEERESNTSVVFCYLRHTDGGNSGARNAGVRAAQGELLLFTDDDVTVSPAWAEAYEAAFREHPSMLASGGCVLPVWEDTAPAWLLEFVSRRPWCGVFASMDLGPDFLLSSEQFFFSNNMAARREIFDGLQFHPEIFGTRTLGDGESGLLEDLRERGQMIGYVPNAVAYHHIPAHRMTPRYIHKWAQHLAGAQMFPRWRGRPVKASTLAREVGRIVHQHWRSMLAAPLVFGFKDPESLNEQIGVYFGIYKLLYLWWVLTDKQVKDVLQNHAP